VPIPSPIQASVSPDGHCDPNSFQSEYRTERSFETVARFSNRSRKEGYLLIAPEEAEIVRKGFEVFVKEHSISETAKWLNANGYRYKTSRSGGKGRLGYFTFPNLDRVLRNRAYVGVKTYLVQGKPMEAKAVWEPLVAEHTFCKAQEILDRVYGSPKYGEKISFYPLRPLAMRTVRRGSRWEVCPWAVQPVRVLRTRLE
jgi:hypothetical protein